MMDKILQVGVAVLIAWIIYTFLIPLLPVAFATIAVVILVLAVIVFLMKVAGLWF